MNLDSFSSDDEVGGGLVVSRRRADKPLGRQTDSMKQPLRQVDSNGVKATARQPKQRLGNLFEQFTCRPLGAVSTEAPPSSQLRFSSQHRSYSSSAGAKRSPEDTTLGDCGSGRSPESRRPRRQVVLDSDTEGETPVAAKSAGRRQQRQESPGPEEIVGVHLNNDSPVQIVSDDEEEEEEEEECQLVAKCEQISLSLMQKLRNSGLRGEGRGSGGDDSEGGNLVQQADAVKACGEMGDCLKPYQLVGINFLMLLKRADVPGAILADEMGLGKTAQTICFLGLLKTLEDDPGPHLVVVPASLLENWRRELARWCPNLKTQLYYGKDRSQTRNRLLCALGTSLESDNDSDDDVQVVDESSDDAEEASGASEGRGISSAVPFNVMLTGYSLFERDSPESRLDREFLRKYDWSHMVLDEAHALKNRTASRTLRLRKLSKKCRRRIMLTGTPLQNDLGELHGLLEFLLPDIFETEEEEPDFEQQCGGEELAVDKMKTILAPFIMRRLKSEVAKQLTKKVQKVEYVEMQGEQERLYRDTVATWCSEAQGKAKKGDDVTGMMKRAGVKRAKNMFVELRKISQHPLLVRRHFSDADVQKIAEVANAREVFGPSCSLARVVEELETYSDFQLHVLAADNPSVMSQWMLAPSRLIHSAKFQNLTAVLTDLKAAGSRPLIFSQWTSCLDLIECLLDHLGYSYLRLDGSTQVADRMLMCDRFNDPNGGVFAFLLSTRAGGQGLNLTGADKVILHDVDFNPQIDRQAEDRCHRLGQTKPVTVIRLVTKGTVDEDILGIAERKLRLDAAVLSGLTAEVDGDTTHEGCTDEGSMQAQLMKQILERSITAAS